MEDLIGFEIDGLRSQTADAELTLGQLVSSCLLLYCSLHGYGLNPYASSGIVSGTDEMRSLIVCYFPRESNKDMIRQAFSPYGLIDSVYLVREASALLLMHLSISCNFSESFNVLHLIYASLSAK